MNYAISVVNYFPFSKLFYDQLLFITTLVLKVKFENVVFSNDGPDAVVKVIDFGLSKVYTSENRYMFDVCGTLYTMSPQVIRGVYTNCADMWAIGVIAYMLLSNKKPFYHRQREVVMEKIINVDYNFRGKGWQNISDDAKDFVARCLVAQPKGRMTAVQACDSKWLNNMKQLEGKSKMSQEEFAATIKENFEAYAGACQLKKLALTIVAHKSNSNEILMLLNAFKEIDKDHDGEISKQDFIELMSGFDYTREEIDSMFSSLDVYAGGFIQYTEFIASSIEAVGKVEETRLREAFDRLDVDSSGYITREVRMAYFLLAWDHFISSLLFFLMHEFHVIFALTIVLSLPRTCEMF